MTTTRTIQLPSRKTLVYVLFLALVLGLLGWAAVRHNTGDQYARPGTPEQQQQTKPARASLLYLSSSAPAGWQLMMANDTDVVIKNPTSNCSVSMTYSTDTSESNAPQVDHLGDTIAGITAKGYTVQKLAPAKLKLTTTRGPKELTADTLSVSGAGQPAMLQQYGYISTNAVYLPVQVSCAAQAGLADADKAVSAIFVNHQL